MVTLSGRRIVGGWPASPLPAALLAEVCDEFRAPFLEKRTKKLSAEWPASHMSRTTAVSGWQQVGGTIGSEQLAAAVLCGDRGI